MSDVKLCECGCGQPAPIAKGNDPIRGYIKGQPRRFCLGHYIKLKNITVKRQWPSVEERFWKNVDKSDDCWIWTGCKTGNGYGAIRVNTKQKSAHRVSWELANGQNIPQGMVVLHSCDNPLCVRPSHLSIGTTDENSKDMARKGRASRSGPKMPAAGERNGSAILTENDVRQIRIQQSQGQSAKQLAAQYGVTDISVRNIVRGKTWKHVE